MNNKKDYRIQVFTICAILIVAVLITVFNVQMIFNVTNRQTEELGSLQMNGIRAQLQETLDLAKQETLKVSSDVDMIMAKGEDISEIDTYLRAQKKSMVSKSCINVYVASEDWHVIPDFDEPENFDPTERIWYVGAKENPGEIYISQPYMDLASDYVCFTVSRLLSDGKTVVSLDYNLNEVQDYINTMSEGGRTALIVTEAGEIAGYNDTALLGRTLSDVLPDYVDILELEKNNQNQVVLPQTIDGEKQTVFCSKTENDWYLILCVNTAQLYEGSYKQLAWLCLVNAALIFTIVSLYLITVKHRRKAEKALHVREDFLANMSGELRAPLTTILNNTNPNLEISSKEGMERIRISALRLSDMVDNLLSFSNIMTAEKKETGAGKQEKILTGFNKRIRFAIIFVILLAMLVSVYLFSVSSIRLGSQQLLEETGQYEYELSQWIIEQKSILSMFCNTISANPDFLDDYEYAVKFLDDITNNYSDISVVYMTNPEAEHTVIMNNGWQPEEGWYVEERQWYVDTIASKDGFNISSPYFDEQTGLYCVTFSQRVYDKEGNFLGNFGIDFYMDKLIDILGKSYTDTGYAFLVDADGMIINHPYAYYQMTQSTSSNVLDKAYRNAYADEGKIDYFTDYDNVRKASVSSKDKDSRFTVIVVKNWWSIYGSIVWYCSIFIIMFGVCVYAVYYLISRLMKWQESVNEQLQDAVDAATAAGNAKSIFLAQMSHEIRTPINAVLGMNEMILRESTDKAILEYAGDIQSAGRTLLSLINSILDFSKIEDGKMEIVDVEYDTSAMINDLANMVSERAQRKNLEFKLDIDESLPVSMFGDDLRVRQVITNLLTNAVKYTEKGTVTLKMSGKRLENNRIDLYVSVSDTGIGIREEDKLVLCQSFQRVDQERNHNIEGTGLGLSIVSKLLQMMGSELKIDSVYGEGSNFYFNLTQGIVSGEDIGDYTKHHGETQLSEENKYLYAPTASILVVDDNEMNLKVVKSLLKRNGILPDTADSGMQCIHMVEKKNYDIIFLDHMMPGMDGIETLQQLQNKNILAENTVVVALTANAIVGAKEQYLEAGFADYLTKPIDVKRLEKRLVDYLPEEKVTYQIIMNKEDEAASVNEPVPVKGSVPAQEALPVQAESESESELEITETNPSVEETNSLVEETHLVDRKLGISYCAYNEGLYEEIIQTYLAEVEPNIAKLEQFLQAKDWHNYAILAHAIKSTSLTIGSQVLSNLAKEHEFAGKDNREEDIQKSYKQFLAMYRAVQKELKNGKES